MSISVFEAVYAVVEVTPSEAGEKKRLIMLYDTIEQANKLQSFLESKEPEYTVFRVEERPI